MTLLPPLGSLRLPPIGMSVLTGELPNVFSYPILSYSFCFVTRCEVDKPKDSPGQSSHRRSQVELAVSKPQRTSANTCGVRVYGLGLARFRNYLWGGFE